MNTFKDMVAADRGFVFLNTEEFADDIDKHRIEGKPTICIIDTDEHLELPGGERLGVSKASIRVFAKVEELPKRRERGSSLNVDGREYIVDTWDEEMGMASISLNQRRGY